MKKIISLLASVLCVFSLSACDVSGLLGQFGVGPKNSESSVSVEETSSESQKEESVTASQEEESIEDSSVEEPSSEEDSSTEETQRHPHNLKRIASRKSTCTTAGNILHWYCETCDQYFSDVDGTVEIPYEETLLELAAHLPLLMAGKEATCAEAGKYDYYICSKCTNTYLDEACTQPCDKDELTIDALPHNMTHYAEIPAVGTTDGVKEHWVCSICTYTYLDEEGTQRASEEDLILYATANLVDFVVEVPEGRDPVVLQLSDTQIIDASQARPGRDGVLWDWWAADKKEERCYQYVRETIQETKPDLIILTGDIVYGEFDDNGSALLEFIQFMEGFRIPWAPVFGNHDNESKMGVDWQCDQFENAEYCLFDQKELTGNGNYSVGIVQGNELMRVFYMMDTNGCGNASAESLANGHTAHDFVGFKQDQIDWYTNQITAIKAQSPETKISFAYHIQQYVFVDAYKKYGFNQASKYQDINIDCLQNKAEGDFGYIGRQMKGPWDHNYTVYNGMKALGVDSIFVGHEHCNSASVVYDGVRFQFGQKSSQYDRFNFVAADGSITGDYSMTPNTTPLMGGTVIVLSETDGAIKDAYIYYCEEAGGKIDWSQFIQYEVNGLQRKDMTLESGLSMISVPFDENVNAYKVTVSSQGKILFNTALMRGKTTFTFTIFLENGDGRLAGMGPYAIRLKPDDGSAAGITGVINASGKYYIDYDMDAEEAVRVETGVWQTFTVDISAIAKTCTEFSLLIATGNILYLRDVAFN